MNFWVLIFGLFAIASLAGCSPRAGNEMAELPGPGKNAKNIILMIGSGMGATQVTAGIYANEEGQLNLERFPITGLQKCHSTEGLITDSAAGATAIACGVKTYNGAIGVDEDTVLVHSILKELKTASYATGLVVTSKIQDAIPAAFFAHVQQRQLYEAISLDLLNTKVDLIIGGGEKYFDQRRLDDRNLLAELENQSYYVSNTTKEGFNDLPLTGYRGLAYFTAKEEPATVLQGRDYLVSASEFGVKFLKARNAPGFFMLIENAQIDWGGHANSSAYITSEVLDFDKAIGAMLDFAIEDGETLVIVTADHETGGFAINPGSSGEDILSGFTTDGVTGAMVPVFAYGPGAELFSGVYENTGIYFRMRKALGLDTAR